MGRDNDKDVSHIHLALGWRPPKQNCLGITRLLHQLLAWYRGTDWGKEIEDNTSTSQHHDSGVVKLNQPQSDETLTGVDYVATEFTAQRMHHFVGCGKVKNGKMGLEMAPADVDRAFWSSRRQLLCIHRLEAVNLADGTRPLR